MRDWACIRLLATRPEGLNAPLLGAISAAGGYALDFPLFGIEPKTLSTKQLSLVEKADVLIVTSQQAVIGRDIFKTVPDSIIPMGKATAEALIKAGFSVSCVPESGTTSETLLSYLPNLTGKKVVLLTGVGGRQYLLHALEKQAAQVARVETYMRHASRDLLPWKDWQEQDINIVLISSLESFRTLIYRLGPEGCQWISQLTVVAVSDRIAQLLECLPFIREVVVAKSPQTEDIVNALTAWMDSS